MYTGTLHLHNLLRWLILILLLWNIFQLFKKQKNLSVSKWLLIASHTTLLLGLYQWIAGPWGLKLIQNNGMSVVMKDAAYRFWAVEHITGMLLAIILITVGHVGLKKSGNTSKALVLYSIALVLILAMVPWPFREAIARPLFPGM